MGYYRVEAEVKAVIDCVVEAKLPKDAIEKVEDHYSVIYDDMEFIKVSEISNSEYSESENKMEED